MQFLPRMCLSRPRKKALRWAADLYSANCSRCHGPEGQGKPIAPSLNVKSFLTETTDLAMQQIITLGVPGTAMPAWGDRMTDAEIQAIVGFMRQWEATAPEVAQPMGPPSGMGGPPWLRNQNTPSANSAALAAPPGLTPTQVPGQTVTDPTAQSTALAGQQTLEAISGGQTGPALAEQDMATHMAQEAENGGGDQGQGQGQGGPPWAQEQAQTSASDALDWRVLILIGSGLSIAFSMMITGYVALKKTKSTESVEE